MVSNARTMRESMDTNVANACGGPTRRAEPRGSVRRHNSADVRRGRRSTRTDRRREALLEQPSHVPLPLADALDLHRQRLDGDLELGDPRVADTARRAGQPSVVVTVREPPAPGE